MHCEPRAMNDDTTLSIQLQPLREEIDAIDAQLLKLLSKRAKLAMEVGAIKKECGAPIFRFERELQVIAQLQTLNSGPLKAKHIETIWREIMAASRALEKPLSAAFLGPVGTYSEQAMHAYFGHAMVEIPGASIDEVFRAVEAGTADYGVVPVENSTEGAVTRTLDLLLRTSLQMSGEVILPIEHQLLTRSGNLEGVEVVCAHAQALAQCQNWLATQTPHLKIEACASNAQAAQRAAQDARIAAIASERAAAHYDLHIAHAMIQDDPYNRTRFAIIGQHACAPTGDDQTSLVFSVKNEPGAVLKILEPLGRQGVSMTRFESRPAKNRAWEYHFYIDLDGHIQDLPVAAALRELEAKSAFLKVLGSYPKAKP